MENEQKNTLDQFRVDNPNLAVTVTWEEDLSFVWDGDGPDPIEGGFYPHTVTVSVYRIHEGELIQGNEYLCGCYSEGNGPHCKDIHGYLPQMLETAKAECLEAAKAT